MKRILIVEDYHALADVESLLCTMEGYDVRIARTGDEGVASFDAFGPDLVLLDLVLPGNVDGFGVLGHIRAAGSTVKVLVVSARIDEATRAELDTDSNVDTMRKPFKVNDLAARIQALLA